MSEMCSVCVCMHMFHSQCSEDWYLFQISKNALLQEVLTICDPVLTEVAGNPFSDFYERWIGPRGINNKTSVWSSSVACLFTRWVNLCRLKALDPHCSVTFWKACFTAGQVYSERIYSYPSLFLHLEKRMRAGKKIFVWKLLSIESCENLKIQSLTFFSF